MPDERHGCVPAQRPTLENDLFDCSVSTRGQHASVNFRGELDISSAGRVAGELDDLRRHGCRRVVIDLADLTFLSASGIGVLVRAARAYAADGSFSLINPSPMCRRILAISGNEQLIAAEPVC